MSGLGHLGYFGNFGPLWAVWAILGRLSHSGPFGPFLNISFMTDALDDNLVKIPSEVQPPPIKGRTKCLPKD